MAVGGQGKVLPPLPRIIHTGVFPATNARGQQPEREPQRQLHPPIRSAFAQYYLFQIWAGHVMHPSQNYGSAYSRQPTAGPSSRPAMGGHHDALHPHAPSQSPQQQTNHPRMMHPLPPRPGQPSPSMHPRYSHPQWARGRPARGYARGGARGHTGSSGPTVYPTASKSTYPDVHRLLDLPRGDGDDEGSQRHSSRMSAITSRSSAASHSSRRSTASLHTISPAERYHLRDGKLVRASNIDADSEDSEEEVPEVVRPGTAPQVGRKSAKSAARKNAPTTIQRSEEPTAIRISESALPASPVRPRKTARNREFIVISSDSEEEDPQGDRAGFLAASAPYRIGIRLQLQKRLPFLLRNLRASFIRTCRRSGIPIHPPKQPAKGVKYSYRLNLTQSLYPGQVSGRLSEYHEYVSEWRCPFCALFGCFDTEDMLRFHLSRDHTDVQMSRKTENGILQYTFCLSEPRQEESSEEEEEEEEVAGTTDPSPAQETTDDDLEYIDIPPKSPSPTTTEATSSVQPDISASPMQVDDTESDTMDTVSPSPRRSSTPSGSFNIALKHEYEEAVLPRERTPEQVRPLRTGLSATGELVPPPPTCPLGPAAEPPRESCRPGGPRIYDLLNELSLEPYGVLAWLIVDREEEIYELADVRDEDKVMMALWNRWIFLNRVDFVFHREDDSYRAGVQKFIDENYVMIHRAAGWKALRAFLIILTANRFLNLREVLKLLNHYDKLVNRKDWYIESSGNAT